MQKSIRFVPLLLAASLLPSFAKEEKKEECPPIFDGKSLAGWSAEPKELSSHWKVEDGMIVGENPDKKGSDLWTDFEYGNYELNLDYQTDSPDYDSGVYVRGNSHQVQIGVSRSLKVDLTACIYAPKDMLGKYPAQSDKVAAFHKLGAWNHLRIRVVGNRIETFLNGEPFVDYLCVALPKKGKIGLQLHAGVHQNMRFRNLEIKPATHPEPALAEPKYDGNPVPAPEGAVALFDGKDASRWVQFPNKKDPDQSDRFRWKIEHGCMEVVPLSGFIGIKEPVITGGHLHIEWATPSKVVGEGQGRGNSGVFIEGFPELQVLDSFGNTTYYDGQAAALYKHAPPLVNASRGPGLWQSYDIHIVRAELDKKGNAVKPATLTVHHNGVLVQDHVAFLNPLQAGTLRLQDHKNPVRYRNIWFQPDAKKEK